MLSRCLASLKAQIIPDGVNLTLIVVDNEAEPNNRAIVEAFAASFPFPAVYSHQPDPGIPQARNRALDEALRLKADWIAFLDDDETANPDWLAEMLGAADRYGADIVQGAVLREGLGEKFGKRSEGQRIDRVGTCNVLFSSALLRKHSFRFDENLRFCGGSDTVFFARAIELGAIAVQTKRAIVTETVPHSKGSYFGQARTARKHAASNARFYIAKHGWWRSALKFTPRAIGNILAGALLMICTGQARRGGKKIMAGLGFLGALARIAPQPYKRIHGN
jgi:GT2 family glycosyltransferase